MSILSHPRWRLPLLLMGMLLLLSLSACSAVDGHLAVGNDLTLPTGRTAKDVVVTSGDLTIPAESTVDGDVLVTAGDLLIDGTVNGDVAVTGGDVTLNGTVNGALAVVGGSLYGRGQVASGSLSITGGSDRRASSLRAPDSGDDGWADGQTWRDEPRTFGERLVALVGSVISAFVKAIIFGAMALALALFLPDTLLRTRQAAQLAPLPTLGIGCLAWPVTIAVGVLFAITIIGIPVTILLVMTLMLLSLLGWLALGSLLGERLLHAAQVNRPRLAVAAAIGTALLTLGTSAAGAIPLFGWLVVWVLSAWGIGAAVVTYGGTRAYGGAREAVIEPGTHSVPTYYQVPPSPYQGEAPPARRPSYDLYAELAAELGLDEEELRDDRSGPTPERPVYPPGGENP